ncbi:uncharacterized protein LOC131953628 isoform X2 [Physella acuta]|uniref:uncharacterized protein LOC131953628 isoform X2 n=1 Tax=Physella acuta TaxID=109671 RepID=UPI0027DE4CB4|nr:uncharacterized protein LOC131953628 isoform X2 [Physella acuta]
MVDFMKTSYIQFQVLLIVSCSFQLVPIEVKTFDVNGSKSIKANYGDSVVLHCEVTGSGGTYAVLSGPELSKFKTHTQNTAVIDKTFANLTCQDAGRYFCWGQNGGGETGPKDFVDVNITCLVEPPPVYQGKPYQPEKMIEVSSEKNTTFQFVVYGYPEPTSYDLRIQTKSNSYSDVTSSHYNVQYIHQEPPFGLVTLTIYDENTKETITYVLGINSEKGRVEVTVEVVKVTQTPAPGSSINYTAIGLGVGSGCFLISVVIVVLCKVSKVTPAP